MAGKCRYCAEEIQEDAIVCEHCREDFTPVLASLPPPPPREFSFEPVDAAGNVTGGFLLAVAGTGACMLSILAKASGVAGWGWLVLAGWVLFWVGMTRTVKGSAIIRYAGGFLLACGMVLVTIAPSPNALLPLLIVGYFMGIVAGWLLVANTGASLVWVWAESSGIAGWGWPVLVGCLLFWVGMARTLKGSVVIRYAGGFLLACGMLVVAMSNVGALLALLCIGYGLKVIAGVVARGQAASNGTRAGHPLRDLLRSFRRSGLAGETGKGVVVVALGIILGVLAVSLAI